MLKNYVLISLLINEQAIRIILKFLQNIKIGYKQKTM